jgi:hypothetical protein
MLLHQGQLNGVRLLRPDTVALMGENQIGDINAGILKTANPQRSNDVDFFPGIPCKWGLGYMINPILSIVPFGVAPVGTRHVLGDRCRCIGRGVDLRSSARPDLRVAVSLQRAAADTVGSQTAAKSHYPLPHNRSESFARHARKPASLSSIPVISTPRWCSSRCIRSCRRACGCMRRSALT